MNNDLRRPRPGSSRAAERTSTCTDRARRVSIAWPCVDGDRVGGRRRSRRCVLRGRLAAEPDAAAGGDASARDRAGAPKPLGGTATPLALPPLDASDALVKMLVGQLSSSPAVAAWLTTNGLLRNFTVVVSNIADGATPVKHLSALRPTSAFQVVQRGGAPYMDSRGYERYTPIASAVAALEPGAVASSTPRSSRASKKRTASSARPIRRSIARSNAPL